MGNHTRLDQDAENDPEQRPVQMRIMIDIIRHFPALVIRINKVKRSKNISRYTNRDKKQKNFISGTEKYTGE